MNSIFKECPCCHEKWNGLTDFVADPFLELVGYQPNLDSPLDGHFVFNHNKGNCFSTLLIKIKDFLYLNSDIVTISKFIPSTKDCQGYCKDIGSSNACSHPLCKAKQIKKILTIINTRDKAIIKKLDK